MKKNVLTILPLMFMLAESNSMDIFQEEERVKPRIRKPEPHDIPKPDWNVKEVPQGCTKETITVTYERNGHEYTVQGDICYKGLKTRSQRKIKLEQQIRNWICQCPDYYLAQHPRVTIKPIEGYERPKTALDSL